MNELISLGESKTLEFKSTLQWDVIKNEHNPHLRYASLKTIAAFLNSEGGTLIIGVDDTGTPLGLDNDLKLLGGSTDRFLQLLSSLITDYVGLQYEQFVKFRLAEVEGKMVCVIDVINAPEPVFAKGPRGKEFFVRVGNTTRPLDPQETMNYAEMKWA
jgi:predicted HTH transcriptional regulator